MKNSAFICIVLLLCSILSLQARKLTVATYNLRYDNKGDSINGNDWDQRYPVAAGLIRFHDFDIFGTQECQLNQIEDLMHSLPGYEYIGHGRDDGKEKGEYTAIFYKSDRFRLLDSGRFWLSEITDRPNTGWDAALPRICTWGYFKDTGNKKRFWFFNLHMDHIGVTARKESAKLVLNKIKELAGNEPVILTGDFNVDQNNESYLLIHNSGVLKDSYVTSPIRYATNGTFNNFRPDSKTDSRIDHIFLSDRFEALRYGILTDSYRRPKKVMPDATVSENFPKEVRLQEYDIRMPSDHFPVMVILKYIK